MPFERCHLSQTLGEDVRDVFQKGVTYRLSITGTSTACNVFGLSLDPGFRAPHPAAHPNFPKKSSFFSGKQIGAVKKISLEMCRQKSF